MAVKVKVPGSPNKIEVKLTSLIHKNRIALNPLIDKISITFDIAESDKSGSLVHADSRVGGLSQGFPPEGTLVDKIKSKAKYKNCYRVRLANMPASVVIELNPAAVHKGFARLDLNPSKLGQSWASVVNQVLIYMLGKKYDWAYVASNGKASQLDIAIDLLNVSMRTLLLDVKSSKHKLKRSLYVGHGGELETMYVFQNSAKHPKITAYDKRSELIKNNGTPQFGAAAHTRIEVRLRPSKAQLQQLEQMKNPFIGISVIDASMPTQWPQGKVTWSHFIAACQLKGLRSSLEAINGEKLRSEYKGALHTADSGIWNAQKIWAKWPGVIAAGIKL